MMSRDSRATLDVVIPTHNMRDVTAACIESVFRAVANNAIATQCVVVDNASTDGTAELISTRWPDVIVIHNEANVGFASACNEGIRHGSGEFVLLLNSDIYARAGAVRRLVEFLSANDEYAAAGGRLVAPDTGRTQVGFVLRAFPRLAGQVALLVGLERFWPTNPVSRGQLMLDFDYGRTQEVDAQPAGACLAVRRRDLEAVGGFDEDFYYWFEDVDLVKRLQQRGRIAYVHDAVFEHRGGTTFAQWNRADVVLSRYAGLLRYFAKHGSPAEFLALRLVVALLAAARALPLALIDRRRAGAYAAVVGLALRPSRARRSALALS